MEFSQTIYFLLFIIFGESLLNKILRTHAMYNDTKIQTVQQIIDTQQIKHIYTSHGQQICPHEPIM